MKSSPPISQRARFNFAADKKRNVWVHFWLAFSFFFASETTTTSAIPMLTFHPTRRGVQSNLITRAVSCMLPPAFQRAFNAERGNSDFKALKNILLHLPSGMSVSRHVAASAPAEAPEIFCRSSCGAYFLKQTATPTVIDEKEESNWRHRSRYRRLQSLTVINSQKSASSERQIVL